MPSDDSQDLANQQRKNVPNIASDLSLLRPMKVLNGLYNFIHKEQAHNLPVSHKYHSVQPTTSINTSAFQSSGYSFDINLPMNIDLIDEIILILQLKNTHGATTWEADTSAPFFIDRFEVRDERGIVQTRNSLDLYLDNTIYLNDFERAKNLVNIGLDNSTYKANATQVTITAGNTKNYRIKLNTFLEKCKIWIKGLRGQIVLRFYTNPVATFSNNAVNSSLTLNSASLLVRELELSRDGRNTMNLVHKENVDYRIVEPLTETVSLALTSGYHEILYK